MSAWVHSYRVISRGEGPLQVEVTAAEIERSRRQHPGLADDLEPGFYGWGGSFQFTSSPEDLQRVCETVILPELVASAWGSTAIGPSACTAFTKAFVDYRHANEFPERIRSQCLDFWKAFRFARKDGMVRLQPRDLLRSLTRR